MAIPQILQQLANTPRSIQQIKSMMNMVQSAGNPQAMMAQMMQTNPQLKQVMDLVQKHGGDPRRAFYETAQQHGVDPDEILNMLK